MCGGVSLELEQGPASPTASPSCCLLCCLALPSLAAALLLHPEIWGASIHSWVCFPHDFPFRPSAAPLLEPWGRGWGSASQGPDGVSPACTVFHSSLEWLGLLHPGYAGGLGGRALQVVSDI